MTTPQTAANTLQIAATPALNSTEIAANLAVNSTQNAANHNRSSPRLIRVELPSHLHRLASLPPGELRVQVAEPVTLQSVLDALDRDYPRLSGTLRDHATARRRPFIRFFAEGEDLSHTPLDAPLPAALANGQEPLLIIAAIAGG